MVVGYQVRSQYRPPQDFPAGPRGREQAESLALQLRSIGELDSWHEVYLPAIPNPDGNPCCYRPLVLPLETHQS